MVRLLLILCFTLVPVATSASAQTLKSNLYFSEGVTGPGWDTHFYVKNHAPWDTTVRVTLLGENRFPASRDYRIRAFHTHGISIRDSFPLYSSASFGSSFETVDNGGLGYLSIDRYVVREGVGILTHVNKDVPLAFTKTHSRCNPGAAHTYLTIANPHPFDVALRYTQGNTTVSQHLGRQQRITVYYPGEPVNPLVVGVAPHPLGFHSGGSPSVISEKITYNANHTVAQICPAN